MPKKFFKKAVSLLAVMVTLVGMFLPAYSVSAASNKQTLIYVGDLAENTPKGNDLRWNKTFTLPKSYSGAVQSIYAGKRPAEWQMKNGTAVYCIEPGRQLYGGRDYTTVQSNNVTSLSLKGLTSTETGRQKIRAIAAAISISENTSAVSGIKTYPKPGGKNYVYQGVMQVIIWEIVLGYRDAYTGKLVKASPLHDNLQLVNSNTINYKAYYNDIVAALQKFLTTPTGMTIRDSTAPTYKWTWNASKNRWEVTLPKDTTNSGVAGSLTYKVGNVTLTKENVSANQVRLVSTATPPPTGTSKVDLNYGVPTTPNVSGLLFNSGDKTYQQLIASNARPDPHNGYFKLAVGTGNLTTKKTDTNKTLMAGVVFGIYADKACKTERATMTTNASGVATSGQLPEGTYYVKEKSLPAQYQKTHALNSTVYTAVVKGGQTTQVGPNGNVVDPRKGTLSLDKADEKQPLDGATFGVYTDAACKTSPVQTLTTNANGHAQSQPLNAGTYYVKEISLPDKYKDNHEMSTKVYTVTVVNDKDTPVNDGKPILNPLKSGLRAKKIDDLGNPVPAISFDVYEVSDPTMYVDELSYVEVTEKDGGFNDVELLPDPDVWGGQQGWWNVRYTLRSQPKDCIYVLDMRAAGLPLPQVQNGYIDFNNNLDVGWSNGEYGRWACYPIVCTSFPATITYSSVFDTMDMWVLKQGDLLDTIVTDWETGVASLDSLRDDDFFLVKERLVGDQAKLYTEDERFYPVHTELGEVTEVNNGDPIVNNAKVRIEIHKKDDLQKPLPDVTFGIYANSACTGTPLQTLVTDANGEAVSAPLEPGKTYWVKELSLPDELKDTHALSTEIKSVVAKAGSDGETVTYPLDYENPHKGDLDIDGKVDDVGNPLDGVTFGVYKSRACTPGTEVDTLITDAKGYAKSQPLDAGQYYVKEISLPDKYKDTHVMSTTVYPVTVQNAQTTHVNGGKNIENPRLADIDLIKIGGDGERIEGASFGVYTNRACTASSLVQTLITDENGYAKSSGLSAGVTYYVKELSLPDKYKTRYIQLDTVYEVTTVYGEVVRAGYDFIVNPTPGEIGVPKTDDLDSPVDGAVFGIYTDEACTALVKTMTTADGLALSGPLDEGRYYVKELSLPAEWRDKLLIDPRVWPVDVVAGEITLVTNQPFDPDDPKSANAPFVDPHPGSLTVKKGNDNGDPLAGAEYLLELSRDDGKTWTPITSDWCSSAGLKNGRLVSGQDGMVTFEGLWTASDFRYRLTEVKAPPGYSLSSEPIFDGVLPAVTARAVVDMRPHSLEVHMTDSEGQPLPGVKLQLELSQDDGETWTPQGGYVVTDKNGDASFTGLRSDDGYRYRLTEIEVPDGCAMASQPLFDGVLAVADSDDESGDTVSSSEVLHYDWDLTFTATDGVVPVLPAAGGPGFGAVALGAAVLASTLAMIFMVRKSKQGKRRLKNETC